MDVIRSGDVVGLKLTLTRSIAICGGSKSHSNAAKIVLSKPPENIIITDGLPSLKGMF
jgi:hypothetical protein